MISNLPIALATAPVRESFEATRLEQLREMPVLAVAVVVLLCALLSFSWLVYRRESNSVPRSVGWLLTFLRTIAFAGVVLIALDIVKREAREVVDRSQIVLLTDASQSMALSSGSESSSTSRFDDLTQVLEQSPLLEELSKRHSIEIVRFAELTEPLVRLPSKSDIASSISEMNASLKTTNCISEIEPTGAESRLGDAVHSVLERYEGLPLAGIVLLSDGGQNAGADVDVAATDAKNRDVPIHTIGFGPLTLPPNVAIRDLVVPKRVYPGDRIAIAALIESHEVAAPTIRVELLRQKSSVEEASWESIADQEIELKPNGNNRVDFETAPGEAGEYIYELRIEPPDNESTPHDNTRRASVAVVDRKLRVLLFSGGPSREYQFLRNQLQRDKNVTLDVLLQSADSGSAQDADTVLKEFPGSRDKLFEYDAIVAIDPDWSQVSVDALRLLDSWVAEQAGGMIVAPGPISTARWVTIPGMSIVRSLFPVVFDPNEVELAASRETTSKPMRLELTKEGMAAEFLRLSKDANDSIDLWNEFPGVYGAQAGVVETKPGATVYARSIGGDLGMEQEQPIFFAEHFFGSGRVFYLNSAELWRLRKLDPALFERLYTNLVQHVAQGRLQRGSSRGTLMIERDRYQLGETVIVRARLTDSQLQPLGAETVEIQVLQPDGQVAAVIMSAEQSQLGSYVGEFRVSQQGPHVVNLAIPDSQEELVERIRVELPALEQQPLVRNESLLRQVAAASGGHYYANVGALLQGSISVPPLPSVLPDRSETRIVYSQPDEVFAERLRLGLFGLICGGLFTEWTLRRWHRLA